MRSHGPVAHVPYGPLATPIEPPLSATASQFLSYRDFSNTVAHRNSSNTADTDSQLFKLNDTYLRIVHPYDTDAFNHFLSMHGLSQFYPLLVTNLRYGFPLGEMPPITDTVIFNNHFSITLYPDTIDKYLTDELYASRMSGPFSRQHVEVILRGPFFCSPLLVSIQTQQPGTPDKLRVCRHLSKGDKKTPSMNSHIHKEDFPTRFDTALKVADIVCSFSFRRARSLLHESHFWWTLPLHGFHLWWPYSSWTSLLATHSFTSPHLVACYFMSPHLVARYFVGCTSGTPALVGLTSSGLFFFS